MPLPFTLSLLFAVTSAGVVIGYLQSRAFSQRHGDQAGQEAQKYGSPPFLAFLFGSIAIAGIFLFLKYGGDEFLWSLPPWLECLLLLQSWILAFGLVGYLAAFSLVLSRDEPRPAKLRLNLVLLVVISGLGTIFFRQELPIANRLQATVDEEGTVLQSSPVSCVPASAANLLPRIDPAWNLTEPELAPILHTTRQGTSVASTVWGFRRLGIEVRKTSSPDPGNLTPPAMLFVDHPDTGPESHAVALMAIDSAKGTFEIRDPLVGRLEIGQGELTRIWHGKALTFPGQNSATFP